MSFVGADADADAVAVVGDKMTVLLVSVEVLDCFWEGNAAVVLLPAESTLTALEFAELVQAEARDGGVIALEVSADPMTIVVGLDDIIVADVVVVVDGAVEEDGDLSNWK